MSNTTVTIPLEEYNDLIECRNFTKKNVFFTAGIAENGNLIPVERYSLRKKDIIQIIKDNKDLKDKILSLKESVSLYRDRIISLIAENSAVSQRYKAGIEYWVLSNKTEIDRRIESIKMLSNMSIIQFLKWRRIKK